MEIKEKTPGQRLLFAIRLSNMTQREFASLIDMSPNGLNMIIKDHNRLNRRLALATELITGVRADWLLTAEGSWMETEDFNRDKEWEEIKKKMKAKKG